MIKIYGPKMSSALRSYWTLEEVGVEYKEIQLNMKEKEHKSEEYLKINPNGKIPTIIDEDKGITLFESMAINHYLARQYKPELAGNTPVEEGLIQQWSHWAILEMQKPVMEILLTVMFGSSDPEIIDTNTQKLQPLLKILDSQLESSKFMVGENFSLADINAGSVILMATNMKVELSAYSNIQAWINNLMERESFKKLMASA